MDSVNRAGQREPWNKGKLVGQKLPFKLKEIWAIRIRLQMQGGTRELALFDLGIDSKLRACDLVKLKVWDVCHGDHVSARAIVMQQKTQRPVQFEITSVTRDAIEAWIRKANLRPEDYLFPSRLDESPHLGTRQYARILDSWVAEIGLDPTAYGTHSMRRTKAIAAPKICERCSCYWATPSWRALSDISASRSMTRSRWPSKPRSDFISEAVAGPGAGGHFGSKS